MGFMGGIPESVRRQMRGVSWQDDARCPRFDDLALLRLPYWDFFGAEQAGELVVAADIAAEVHEIFAEVHASRFPIAQMRRVEEFSGSDALSMQANNCSAFNFRVVAGTGRLSYHARGRAIDVNPIQNPWILAHNIEPAEGAAYLDREHRRPGMLIRPCPVINAFVSRGWTWGGDWVETRDYHHFEKR